MRRLTEVWPDLPYRTTADSAASEHKKNSSAPVFLRLHLHSDLYPIHPTHASLTPNDISIGSAIFAGLTSMINTKGQTDRQTTLRATSVAVARI